MDQGVVFLKNQIANAVALHDAFVQALQDHESQAHDTRYRDLCGQFIPKAMEHQRMLAEYQMALGGSEGIARKAADVAYGAVRDLADVVTKNDFRRLVGDIVMARQLEDTFKIFREAGRALRAQELAHIGEIGERHHDEFVKDANRLAQQLFIDKVRGSEATIRAAERPNAPL